MGENIPNGIGASPRRKEDQRFLTGAGNYTDDINLQGQTYAYFLRSPHASAAIKNTKAAAAAPGVVGIFTGADLAEAKVGGLPCGWLITDVNGQPMKEPPHPPLAQGKVNHVGDQVAVVVDKQILLYDQGYLYLLERVPSHLIVTRLFLVGDRVFATCADRSGGNPAPMLLQVQFAR